MDGWMDEKKNVQNDWLELNEPTIKYNCTEVLNKLIKWFIEFFLRK